MNYISLGDLARSRIVLNCIPKKPDVFARIKMYLPQQEAMDVVTIKILCTENGREFTLHCFEEFLA